MKVRITYPAQAETWGVFWFSPNEYTLSELELELLRIRDEYGMKFLLEEIALEPIKQKARCRRIK